MSAVVVSPPGAGPVAEPLQDGAGGPFEITVASSCAGIRGRVPEESSENAMPSTLTPRFATGQRSGP